MMVTDTEDFVDEDANDVQRSPIWNLKRSKRMYWMAPSEPFYDFIKKVDISDRKWS